MENWAIETSKVHIPFIASSKLQILKALLAQPGWLHRLKKRITATYHKQAGIVYTSLARKHGMICPYLLKRIQQTQYFTDSLI